MTPPSFEPNRPPRYPSFPGSPDGSAAKPPRKKTKMLVIVLSVIVALVVGLGVVILVTRGSGDPQASSPNATGANSDGSSGDILQEKPGTEAPRTFRGEPVFDACAILNREVLKNAGLVSSRGFRLGGARLTPDADRAELMGKGELTGDCGGPVTLASTPTQSLPGGTQVSLQTHNHNFTTASTYQDIINPADNAEIQTQNGIKYARVPTQTSDLVKVHFGDGGTDDISRNAFILFVFGFSQIPDNEAVLQKIITGVTQNIAAGPKSIPERSYPTPFNFVAKPCDSLTPEIFNQITGKKTDGIQRESFGIQTIPSDSERPIIIGCDQTAVGGVSPSVAVLLTTYPTAQGATTATKNRCADKKVPLATPIGDVSCADGHVYFRAGRTLVDVGLRDGDSAPQDLVAKILPGAQKMYEVLAK